MKYLAPGVWRLKEAPRPVINVYLAEDVLVDAGRRWDKRRIFGELEGREISEVALTHVHPDHQGCAKAVCEARGVPLACHADDVDAMEGRRPVAASPKPTAQLFGKLWTGPRKGLDRASSLSRCSKRPRVPRSLGLITPCISGKSPSVNPPRRWTSTSARKPLGFRRER